MPQIMLNPKTSGDGTSFALVLASVELSSSSHVLKGSVQCLDCITSHDDLSDIKVLVKCSKVKKLAVATTKQDGTFQTELPSDSTTQTPTPPSSCLTKILGGPDQIYAFQKNMVSKVSKVPSESNSYTTSTPLVFYSSCPLARDDDAKCRARSAGTGSSKTIDLPLPPEWGLAPSSYYMPFIPIIGIP
ncbi:hypothetical protein Vadar_033859 [Vaccinium darrowii]|uniref:Uncharacterized protein n=1 Tax=Vaccinium darrowii TaxID=229202 RepID=A0ACB7XE92_9ERIC|nr:hypothetical protein Vadar_033859 [Vaccinium darrowii]